jgi:thiosulfate dehydrogenase [quinone] large subunit
MKAITEFFRPRNIEVQDPPFAKFLFGNTAVAWVWLVVRVWLGYQWVDAGLHKVTNPAWVETGTALQGYWLNAVKIPETGRAAISFDWYRSFLQLLLDNNAHTWFAPLVAYGEVLVGIALILGAFVGVAAFFGAFMNWNFMMAGSASTNPMLFVVALVLILAWKVAGYYGLDRWLLPMLGTPWKVGTLIHPEETKPQTKPIGA